MTKRTIVLILPLLLAVFAASALSQGLYWESTTSGIESGSAGRLSTCYYMPKMYKQSEGANQTATILRGDKELIYRINYSEKTYTEMTFAELEAVMHKAGAVLSERMKMMEGKLKDMPEEQRKMVEQMMSQNMKEPTVEVSKTGKSKSVSGYSCKEYDVKLNKKHLFSIWATTEVGNLAAMKSDLLEFTKRMAAMSPMHGSAVAEGFSKIDGFAMETDMEGTTTTVTKIEKRNVPASEFDVPAGFTKVKSNLLEGMDKDKGE